ncbi:ras-related protein RAB1BV-like, partial [Fagus crenata]
IRNWIRNIEQHASDSFKKILVGNKAHVDERKRVGACFVFNQHAAKNIAFSPSGLDSEFIG